MMYRIVNRFSANDLSLVFKNHVRCLSVQAEAARREVPSANYKEKEYTNARPYSDIPGPSVMSLVLSNLPGGRFYKKDFAQIIRMYREDYGVLMKLPSVFGKTDVVFTHNPDHFQTIFRTEGSLPSRLGLYILQYYRQNVRPEIYGKYQGLANTQGEGWGRFRKAVNPVMIHPKNAKLYIPIIDQVTGEFINRIKKILHPTSNQLPEEFEMELNHWSLESLGVVALDTRLGLISDKPNERAARFMDALKDFFELIFMLEFKPSLWRFFPTPTFNRFIKTMDTMTDIAVEYIGEVKLRLKANLPQPKDEHEQSVLEKLLKIDENISTVMAMDMIFAGVDTTSSAITGLLYLLAKNPDKQAILRKEIRSVLPEKESRFTVESMRQLPYLRACIKESQRLLPTVGTNARNTGQDLVLDGYQIPKGTYVLMCGSALALEEKHYQQASKFLPERWLKQETSAGVCPATAKSAHPFIYLPFGYGPRMCIGRRFAEMEIEILISKIVRNFHVSWDLEDLKFRSETFNVPDVKLMFTMVEIDE